MVEDGLGRRDELSRMAATKPQCFIMNIRFRRPLRCYELGQCRILTLDVPTMRTVFPAAARVQR